MVLVDTNPHFITELLDDEGLNSDGFNGEGQTDDPPAPPTNLYSDEPPVETDFHRNQIDLLIRLLKYWWSDRSDFYISGNLTVYYNQKQLKKRDFLGPDVFIVLGAEQRDRRSWTIWEEDGKYPNVVIELLSNSTAGVDKTTKKDLYQDIWRVQDYFWFHPETLEFAGFHLMNGRYEPIVPTPIGTQTGLLWSEQLQLYLGIDQRQLRWFTAQGILMPLPEDQERQAKEQAQRRVEQLEALLRTQGIDPEQL